MSKKQREPTRTLIYGYEFYQTFQVDWNVKAKVQFPMPVPGGTGFLTPPLDLYSEVTPKMEKCLCIRYFKVEPSGQFERGWFRQDDPTIGELLDSGTYECSDDKISFTTKERQVTGTLADNGQQLIFKNKKTGQLRVYRLYT